MKLGFGLNLEQTQKLIMTPELRQAITILQLSALELTDYVEQELLENPMLEIKDSWEEREEAKDKTAKENSENEKFDIDWQEYFNDRDLGYVGKGTGGEVQEELAYENFIAKTPSLQEHLLSQFNLLDNSKEEKIIGQFLIGCINEQGYLTEDLGEISTVTNSNQEDVERVLEKIQSLEPVGIGARSIQECLLIQLKQQDNQDPILHRLITKHLEDVAAGRLAKLAHYFGMPPGKLQDYVDIIKKLDPKPGLKYASLTDVRYIVPDIVIERVEGQYVVIVNDSNTPRLMISNAYKAMLNKGESQADHQVKEFVETKLNSAAWLIKSIEQRRMTLYKVADCIVKLQRDFLDRGIKYLKPMTLKDIAELVELHESTVSRATSNKYVQTPQGVFELRFFFSSGLASDSGIMTSSESVKKLLEELIKEENPQTPYSDQKLTDILKERGIRISRRTIAKYRDELNIPNATKRKRY